jgi:hypothetical protein
MAPVSAAATIPLGYGRTGTPRVTRTENMVELERRREMAALLDFESVLPVPYGAPVAAGSLSYTHGGCYPGTGTQGG